jgi:uncharacterized membrane protein
MTTLIAGLAKKISLPATMGRSIIFFSFIFFILDYPCLYADTPEWVSHSTWAIAIGRFHPVVLHLPIGCCFAAIGLEILGAFKRHRNNPALTLIWGLTAITSLLASVLGWFLSADGYGDGAVDSHQNSALVFTALCWLCWILRLKGLNGSKSSMWGFRVLVLTTSIVMGVAGHEGGNLTHGENYLFEKLPADIQSLFITEQSNAVQEISIGEVDNMSAVAILQDRCASCHGEKKQKGDYRLDNLEAAMTPGESEETPIVPGDAMSSFLVRLITLSQDDDEVMPPAKKKPLSPEEIVQIIQWIDAGANWHM